MPECINHCARMYQPLCQNVPNRMPECIRIYYIQYYIYILYINIYIYIHRSEGFPLTCYFFPGCDGDGTWDFFKSLLSSPSSNGKSQKLTKSERINTQVLFWGGKKKRRATETSSLLLITKLVQCLRITTNGGLWRQAPYS